MADPTRITPRDRLLRDQFTPAERLLFASLLLCAAVVFVVANPRSVWVLGFFLIVGCFSVVTLKTHEHTHPFFVDFLWSKFWLATAPFWLLCIVFTFGLTNNPLQSITVEGRSYWALDPGKAWLPTSADRENAWIVLLGFGGAYLVSTGLWIVPKSRSFFERLFRWLCLFAVTVCIFGFVQKALGVSEPPLSNLAATGEADFFACFPYDGHWAAFALIWSTACTGMALLKARSTDERPFVRGSGPWYLTGAILLAGSGLLLEARPPAAVLLIWFSILSLLVSHFFVSESTDPQRKPLSLGAGLVATSAFAVGLLRLFAPDQQSAAEPWLRSAAWEMFQDRPLFGWGIDAFHQILPFYSSDALLAQRHEQAFSDVLQYLAEWGLFGLAGFVALSAFLTLRYFCGRYDIRLCNHFLLGCLGVLVIAVFDSPFMSPAVVFSFLLLAFSAFRWADITRNKVDEVDARPALVTPASERRVPFFQGDYKEVEK